MRAVWWTLGVLVFILLFFGLGEVGFDLLFAALVLIGTLSYSRPRWVLIFIGIAGLALQFSSYRIFGSAKVVDTPPLEGARVVIGLESPSLLRFSDGGTAELAHVYFPRSTQLGEINDATWRLYYYAGERSRTPSTAVRMKTDGGAEFKRRCDYWCGNTFFPTFLPRRLPRHVVEDFGSHLIRSGLAVPALDLETVDVTRESPALKMLDTGTDFLYRPMGGVRRGDERTIALGRRLAIPASRYFVAGAYLLVAAQDSESYPGIAAEIRRRLKVNENRYDAIAQARDGSLTLLLDWVDHGTALRQAKRFVPGPNTWQTPYIWVQGAQVLASHGDLRAFDTAMRAWLGGNAPDAETRGYADTLPALFHWPAGSPKLQNWYTSLRPILRGGRDEWGRVVFWLEGGQPFDQRYLETMDSFLNAEAKR